MSKKWYVVHAYSGFEKNVARALKERVALSNLGEFFGEIMVPTEEVVEMRAGQKRRSERKFFPGYVLVEMELNDDTWHLVKETPRVMGFIGGKADSPAPLSEREAQAILDRVPAFVIRQNRGVVADGTQPGPLKEPGGDDAKGMRGNDQVGPPGEIRTEQRQPARLYAVGQAQFLCRCLGQLILRFCDQCELNALA